MNKLTLKNGMVYQSGKRIERKNIYICDGIIMEISEDVLEGTVIDCEDILIAPKFNKEDRVNEFVSGDEITEGTFNLLYNNLVKTHKVTIERLLDFLSDGAITVGEKADFTFVNIDDVVETKSLSYADALTYRLNFQFA